MPMSEEQGPAEVKSQAGDGEGQGKGLEQGPSKCCQWFGKEVEG